MANMGAILAFLQGAEAHRRKVAERLTGSPCSLRLTYLGGHPGIWEPAEFFVGRVADRLRLVDQRGELCYDLPIERITGLGYGANGQVELHFEPTAGLMTTVAFQAPAACYRELSRMLM
jgi:hypothetical protein